MKTVVLILGLALTLFGCHKKKENTEAPTVAPTPTHEPNDAEKQLFGNWILDSSLAYIEIHDSIKLKERKTYNDPVNCRINFTSQEGDAKNFLVEDGLKCALVSKAWHIESDGQLIIGGSNRYPYHTITGNQMLFVQFAVDDVYIVRYYLHKN